MAITKQGFTIANSLCKDANGFSTGVIGEIKQDVITQQSQSKRGEIDETTSDIYIIPIISSGNNAKPLQINLMLGTKINPNPLDTVRKGTKNVRVYNKLTTFLLKTGCLLESELDDLPRFAESAFKKFNNLKGVCIKFKSEKNKGGFENILISTIELLDDTLKTASDSPVKKTRTRKSKKDSELPVSE